MNRTFRLLFFLSLFASLSIASFGQQIAKPIPYGATLPATCTVGDLFNRTATTIGIYTCTATNTWTAPGGGSSGLTTGSTSITGGTDTKVLFNNAGALGEYTISGTGNVVMSGSPTIVTPTIASLANANHNHTNMSIIHI